jgi:hypothetical protein
MKVRKILSIFKKKSKGIISPIFYSYTGYRIFNLIQRLNGYREEKQRFFKALKYEPDIKDPRSFNEKVLWKKFYDRNPLLPIVADKYLVRRYIKDILGEKEAEKILIPLLFVTDKPINIPFKNLPYEYIIKANHSCKQHILVENINGVRKYTVVNGKNNQIIFNTLTAEQKIIDTCNKWLSKPYGYHKLQWAYQPIKRKIVIEKLLRDSNGKIPDDYKFSIINGKCELIQVYYDRFIEINRAWYTPDWTYIDVEGAIKKAPKRKKPDNLKQMVKLAEKLARDFDFIRVDLYLVDRKIYFGELTNYPMAGKTPFRPRKFDFELGSKWEIVPGYWLNK